MRPINPGTSVDKIQADPAARFEQSRLIVVADNGVCEVQKITFAAKAATNAADFVILQNVAGDKWAIWLDKTGSDVEPAGTLYSACDQKTRVDIHTISTAVQIATAVVAAAQADDITYTALVDNGDGSMNFVQTNPGNAATPVPHNTAENAAGSITVSTTTAGVASSGQSTYFTISDGGGGGVGTEYYFWNNVGSGGTDPGPIGSATAQEVDYDPGASKATINAAIIAAMSLAGGSIDAVIDASSGDLIITPLQEDASPTDIDAGTTPWTAFVGEQGQPGVAGKGDAPGDAVDQISNDPASLN